MRIKQVHIRRQLVENGVLVLLHKAGKSDEEQRAVIDCKHTH